MAMSKMDAKHGTFTKKCSLNILYAISFVNFHSESNVELGGVPFIAGDLDTRISTFISELNKDPC